MSSKYIMMIPLAMTVWKTLFLFISRLDADVEFCKVSSSTELRDKFGDERERISVLDSHSIQCMIVLDQPE